MKPLTKVGIVVAGYLAAAAAAWIALEMYIAATAGPDRNASAGMYAFGDSVYFLVVFGLAAIPATAAALYFLRPYRMVWRILAVVCVFFTSVSAAAGISYFTRMQSATYDRWLGLAPLWIFAAPLFGGAFFLAGLFAPAWRTRVLLLVAAVLHVALFVGFFLYWRAGPR
jgi:hypothetical protein